MHRRFGVVMKGRYTTNSLQGVVAQYTLTLILSTYMFLPHTCIKKLFLMLVKYLIISELLYFPSLP